MSLALVAQAAEARERAADPYGSSRLRADAAHAPPVRDLSVLGAYPPEAPLSAAHSSFPAAVAPRTTVYPPSKSSPAPTAALPTCGAIADCSFETGDGWFGADVADPLLGLGVYGAGVTPGHGLFSSAPTEGSSAALTGFDGDGPGDIVLGQDLILPPAADRLVFDYRAGWDMYHFAGSTKPRTFSVQLQPWGGGAPLLSMKILTAAAGTVTHDTGVLTVGVDLSSHAGQPVRLLFVWHVPESHTGPALFQLDRVQLLEKSCLAIDNCSFESAELPAWTATDLPSPLIPAQVAPAGAPLYLNEVIPSDGTQAFVHGWDGGGPGDIRLSQDVVLPAGTSAIEFDYRAWWNNTGTQPRTFQLDVEPSGGGAVLFSQPVLTAAAGTSSDGTGLRTGAVDLVPFAGQAVRLVFRWHVPEPSTGPGEFTLDHVRLTQGVCASIGDCSFESGAIPAWTAADAATPFIPMQVIGPGYSPGFGFFPTDPTDGEQALVHGFDASGPDVIALHQDITLPLWADLLRFDYRAAWDMLLLGNSTLPRTFEVSIEPWGGGPALASDDVLVAPPLTQVLDTGPRSRTLPVGAFAGQPVRIVFRWAIPESFTGPGLFQLDRVGFDNSVLAVGPGGSPGQALVLRPAMPNPSRDATSFAFTLPHAGDVELEIVDVRGARVWSERLAGLPAGEHRVAWNGVRSGGGLAAAGVYYARVRTPAGSSSRMFVRVR